MSDPDQGIPKCFSQALKAEAFEITGRSVVPKYAC